MRRTTNGFLSGVGAQTLTPRQELSAPAPKGPRTSFSLSARIAQASGTDWRRGEVSVDGKQSTSNTSVVKSSPYQPLSEWMVQTNKRKKSRQSIIRERTRDLRCKDEGERAEIIERTQRTQDFNMLHEQMQQQGQALVHRGSRNSIAPPVASVSLPEHMHRGEISSSSAIVADAPSEPTPDLVRRSSTLNTRGSRLSRASTHDLRRLSNRRAPSPPPAKPFPHSLGPFALQETEAFPAALKLQTAEDGLRTWTVDKDTAIWNSSEELVRLATCIATWPIRGRIHPLQSLNTMSDEERKCMGAPPSAASFAWTNVEPIEFTPGSEGVVAEVSNAGSADVACVLRGGFVFCDAAEKICAVCTIGPGPKGTGMQFGEPIDWDPVWTGALRDRFSPITIQALKDHEAYYYGWIRPHEPLLSDLNPPVLKHGGFVYLFHKEIMPDFKAGDVYQDRVFPLVRVSKSETRPASKEDPGGFKFAKDTWSRGREIRENVDEKRRTLMINLSQRHNISLGTVQDIRREFDQMDVDGDEVLTKEEFEAWVHKELKLKPGEGIPQHHLVRTFQEADKDGSGEIDFEEFLLWRHARHFVEDLILDKPLERRLREVARDHGLTLPEVDDIKKVFDKFDLDGSGMIERDEFKKCLVVLMSGKEVSDLPEQRLQRYWREIDRDQSGTVSLDEFLEWYIKYFYVPKSQADQSMGCGPITQAYASLGLNRFRPLATSDYDD